MFHRSFFIDSVSSSKVVDCVSWYLTSSLQLLVSRRGRHCFFIPSSFPWAHRRHPPHVHDAVSPAQFSFSETCVAGTLVPLYFPTRLLNSTVLWQIVKLWLSFKKLCHDLFSFIPQFISMSCLSVRPSEAS